MGGDISAYCMGGISTGILMSVPLPWFPATLSYHPFLLTSFFYLPYATQKRIERFFSARGSHGSIPAAGGRRPEAADDGVSTQLKRFHSPKNGMRELKAKPCQSLRAAHGDALFCPRIA